MINTYYTYNMNYNQVDFTYRSSIDTGIINDVLAGELGGIGFESFTEGENGLSAFILEKTFDEIALKQTLSVFPLEGVDISYTVQFVPGQDWNEEWEKNYFKPILIDRECIIRASFHDPAPGMKYDIVIDPRMAFGTGNHETTYLMIGEMLKLDLQASDVLDMGCGTAVLAILAAMKGASRVVAVDIDEWAYNNALDNIRMNHTPQIDVRLGGAEQLSAAGTFNCLFANINRNILLNDIRNYVQVMISGSILFMSGFYVQDIPAIRKESEANGLRFVSFSEKNNWAAVRFEKL